MYNTSTPIIDTIDLYYLSPIVTGCLYCFQIQFQWSALKIQFKFEFLEKRKQDSLSDLISGHNFNKTPFR